MRRFLLVLLLAASPALAEVGVTDGPKGVVVNPANGKAYVAFPELGVVKIVNGASVKTLTTGANVKDLTFDPHNGRVYAMNRGPGTVSVIDPVSDAVVQTIKADRGSLTALNPVTNKLYVSASTGTDPSVVDLASGETRVIHAGTEGNALSVDTRTDRIYFVGYEDNFLTIVDGKTLLPTRLTVPGWHQWDSAFDEARGKLYLPSPNSNAVTVVDTAHGDVVSTIGTGGSPVAVAVNRVTGRAYVVNYESSDVTVIDHNTPIATVKVGLWPQQIAVNSRTGKIYVASMHDHTISVIDGKTNTLVTKVAANTPWSLAVNEKTNTVYAANRLGGMVTVIDGATNKAAEK